MVIGRERVKNIQLTFKKRMTKIWYQLMEYVEDKTLINAINEVNKV